MALPSPSQTTACQRSSVNLVIISAIGRGLRLKTENDSRKLYGRESEYERS